MGIVVKETDDMISLAESIGDHGKGELGCETIIPRVVIKRMRRLKVVSVESGAPEKVADDLELIPDDAQLPSIEEMSGLVNDITDGMSLRDYLKEIRNG